MIKSIRANFYFPISVKWAQIKGTTYRLGAIVVTGSELMPSFAKIVDILILRSDCTCIIFVCEAYLTDCFNSHYHSYEAVSIGEILFIKQKDLADYHAFHEYKIHFSNSFIPVKYHILEFLST